VGWCEVGFFIHLIMTPEEGVQRRSFLTKLAAIDLRSLAAFRVGLSVVLLWDLSVSLSSACAFFSDAGFLPLGALDLFRESPWQWSVHTWSGSYEWQIALILVNMAAAVCLLVGYRTQMATVVCWVLLCSLHIRNPVILNSCDLVIRLLLFWSMWLPLGAQWSLDSLRGRKSSFSADGHVATIGSAGILLQVCFIYCMGAIGKNGVEWQWDGTAIYYALSLDQFVTSTGRRLLNYPELCRYLTFGTWWLEIVAPALAFVPFRNGFWRLLVVSAFWGLHLALWVCFRLGPFPLTMMVAWLLFLPSAFWNVAGAMFSRKSGSTPLMTHEATRRHGWMRHPCIQGFSLVCVVYITLWNLRGLNLLPSKQMFPQWVNPFGYVLEIQQYWPMFAPRPPSDDGWVIMEAVLRDGTHVDLLRHGKPVRFEKPAELSAEFEDYKWQKVILNLWDPNYAGMRSFLGNHLAFEWNGQQPVGRQISGWVLWYMREDTQPNSEKTPPDQIELLRVGFF